MPNCDVPLTLGFKTREAFPWTRVSETFSVLVPSSRGCRARLRRQALEHIICEAVIAARGGMKVSYSRRANSYSGLQRYFGAAFSHRRIPELVNHGVDRGLFVETRAKPGDHRRTHLQSTFEATDQLVDMFEAVAFDRVVHEIIRLKDDNKHLIDYVDTEDTVRLRNELAAINRFLLTLNVGLPEDVQRSGPFVETKLGRRLVEPIQLYRIFNRGSFESYGRVHGWYQNLPKPIRSKLTLNGDPVVEVDFKASHIAILYAERGLQPPDDSYDGAMYNRQKWKRALLIGINCDHPNAVLSRLQTDFQMSDLDSKFLMDLILIEHASIADCFYADQSVRLMKIESDIVLNAMKSLIELGIPCLPVHDSLIVPEQNEQLVKAAMIEAFQNKYPGIISNVVRSIVDDQTSLGRSDQSNIMIIEQEDPDYQINEDDRW